jgi:signal transduction histidine kinase/DNA-binding LacI/PurR family transcriptional regulator
MRIALYLKNLDEEYQISVYKGIRTEVEALGIDLVCVQGETIGNATSNQQEPFPSRHYLHADGNLFLSTVIIDNKEFLYNPELGRLFTDTPCVSIGNRLFDFPSIIIKSRVSTEQLMEHLINFHGYRKFLYIGGPVNHRDNIVREHVFRRSINTWQRTWPELGGVVINGGFHAHSAMNILKDYIAKNPDNPLDVIVAANDNMAIGALKVLNTIDDPRWSGCAVTGFDDIPQARLEIPALTTVRQPLDELGSLAVRTLHDLIEGKPVPPVRHIESTVQIRNSCGCDRAKGNEGQTETAKEIRELRETFTLVQQQAIKSEQYLRYISFFGQELTTIESMSQLVSSLQGFLNNIGNRTFFLLIQTPEQVHDDVAQLVYKRLNMHEALHVDENKTVSLREFFNETKNSGAPARARCTYKLRSGTEPLGLIVYEAEDSIHPYICSGATYIANTVKRLRIMDDEKEHSRKLEEEVLLRTRDLVETNRKLKQEARRRIAVEAEVLRISEMERLRFSLDLHDDICQRLAGISMYSKSLASKESSLQELSEMIDETLLRTRRYAHDSFPVELDSLGLNEAFGSLCQTVEKQAGCECRYDWTAPEKSGLTGSQEINLYRIVQEAMNNVVKHAKATVVNLTVALEGTDLVVRVKDNGRGNPKLSATMQAAKSDGRKRTGLGLRSMQYRAHQIGAEYAIHSSEKSGTLVEIRLQTGQKSAESSLDQDF